MTSHEMIVCLATDAFRIAMGVPPKNFSPADVARYVENMAEFVRSGEGTKP